jgi:hypothetical protein
LASLFQQLFKTFVLKRRVLVNHRHYSRRKKMGQAIAGATAVFRLPGPGYHFSKSKAVEGMGHHFFIVNDNVMGGRSESAIQTLPEKRGLLFFGVVLKNGGGFVSCRTDQDFKPVQIPSGAVSMVIRVEGDGKQYKASLSDGKGGGPFASTPTYFHDFATRNGEEISITLPLCDFKPSFGGRLGRDRTSLDPSQMVQMGFMLSYLDASCEPNQSVVESETEFSLRIFDVGFEASAS